MERAEDPTVLFLHIGWAREYRGAPPDRPQGTFGYMKAGNEEANEAINFKSYKGRCYGYAPQGTINLLRLGAPADADHQDQVLIVFTATNPEGSGRYIVGWYRNARVYAKMQATRWDRSKPYFVAEAKAADCHLVFPVDDRTFFIPSMRKGWPGLASAYYASASLSRQDMNTLLSYINGVPSNGFVEPHAKPSGDGLPRQNDAELRVRVEAAARRVVRAYYEDRGWAVESVEEENFGWDLNVTRGARVLRVEVKGRNGVGAVELTPNEYDAMTRPDGRMSYRLAIVHNALTSPPLLSIFQYVPGENAWVSEQGDRLILRPMTGAIVTF